MLHSYRVCNMLSYYKLDSILIRWKHTQQSQNGICFESTKIGERSLEKGKLGYSNRYYHVKLFSSTTFIYSAMEWSKRYLTDDWSSCLCYAMLFHVVTFIYYFLCWHIMKFVTAFQCSHSYATNRFHFMHNAQILLESQ